MCGSSWLRQRLERSPGVDQGMIETKVSRDLLEETRRRMVSGAPFPFSPPTMRLYTYDAPAHGILRFSFKKLRWIHEGAVVRRDARGSMGGEGRQRAALSGKPAARLV